MLNHNITSINFLKIIYRDLNANIKVVVDTITAGAF